MDRAGMRATPGAAVRETDAAVRESDATVRETDAAVRGSGAAVREPSVAMPEPGAGVMPIEAVRAQDSHSAASPTVDRAAVDLIARCDAELVAAQLATDPADRFLHAHLAALRLAGALLLASGARPPRGRPRSAWERLAAAVPVCAPWATFFTSGARVRAAIDAGVDPVDDAFASTWVAAAEDFRDAVCLHLGIDPYADLRSSMAWAS